MPVDLLFSNKQEFMIKFKLQKFDMETILIQANNDAELKLIQAFLEEHKLKNRILSEDDKEDIVLGKLMEETDETDIINTNEFLSKLRS